MSTIAVDNIRPSAGGTSFSTIGVARSMVDINFTGLTVTTEVNVTSVTDNGVGHATVNFTTSWAAADYIGAQAVRDTNDNASTAGYNVMGELSDTYSTSAHEFHCTIGGTDVDSPQSQWVYFGGLS